MEHHEIQREDGRVTFGATDRTIGYGVLAVLLVVVGTSLLWWWPGGFAEFVAPWRVDEFGHGEAVGYGMSIAVVAGLLVVLGGYLSDRGRCHEIEFDAEARSVSIREWWRGVDIDVDVLFERFSSFEVHRPATRDDTWQLGVVLENDSYWRLDRDADRQSLQERTDRLSRQMDFGGDGEFEQIEAPERIDVQRRDGAVELRWNNYERVSTRIVTSLATILFSAALLVPVLAVFQGALGLLAGAVGLGAALFAVPLFVSWSSRASWPFVIGWFVVVLAAVAGLGAHWAYFPVATAGVAIFARSFAAIVSGLWSPEDHSLVVDEEGRIREDGQLLEVDGEPVGADEFEGALANVTDVRPPTMNLVWPGGRRENRDGHLGEGHSHEGDEGHREPIEVEAPGLSLFEVVAAALIVDDAIRRHQDQ